MRFQFFINRFAVFFKNKTIFLALHILCDFV